MNRETIDQIRALWHDGGILKTFMNRYDKAILNPNCDKFGKGFGEDVRFPVFKTKTPVHFSAWTGMYGSSACSVFHGVTNDKIDDYFVRALNEHQVLLFETMGRLMEEDAAVLVAEAEAEIAESQRLLDEVKRNK